MKTKYCPDCNTHHPVSEFHYSSDAPDNLQTYCKGCKANRDFEYHKKSNAKQMYVNGKYIPVAHPLHKPGRYRTLDDAWSHCEIDERSVAGEVYIIRNKAWTDWLKVGKAVSAEDRLNGYQTSSPFRDFVLEYYEYFDNRHQAEAEIHRMLERHKDCHDRKGEWFKTYIPTIKEVMNDYRNKEASVGHRDEHCPQYDLALCDTGS